MNYQRFQYKIFTLPNCGECKEIKDYLEEKSIKAEEINIAKSKGRRELGEYYKQGLLDKVERDENKQVLIPIVLLLKNNKIKAVAHNKEGLVKCLSEV